MIGTIERVKNNVLLKCSTLNDEIVSKTLVSVIEEGVYHFAEDLITLINDLNFNITEEDIRNNVSNIIESPIIKKIKRKLFIDSLALQITNDSFVEDYFKEEIDIKKLKLAYIKELNNNKSSNQLNMTEDLNLTEIIQKLKLYIDKDIIEKVKENIFLVNAVNSLVDKIKKELEDSLKEMIDEADLKYLDILVNEINMESKEEKEIKMEEEGEIDMIEKENVFSNDNVENKDIVNKFNKYDDMTLYNKVILTLNTKEEKLTRKEKNLEKRKEELDERLSSTNKNIESNIERENLLSERRLQLNSKEIELNAKLSEAEVIFLNMKPLIKGLNKIKDSDEKGA